MEEALTNSYLLFNLHKEIFSINIKTVLEVLLDYKVIDVPDAPRYITGMINFRGDIIPVINFREKFNLEETEVRRNVIVVMEFIGSDKNIKYAAVVDDVVNVIEIEDDKIKPTPEFGSKYNPEYLTGMIQENDNYYLILDIKKVFSDEEIEIINKTSNNS
ncbi:MAG: purine-binding chemotaxis protein CheW [bacterium]|nr:purine-binding chemotaxis protein CheW [bacterium]